MFDILDVSASGLMAQRTRMDTIAGNILHVNTTRNAQGKVEPYRRRFVVLQEGQAGDPTRPGVHVKEIGLDNKAAFREVYDPGHKDAGKDGIVRYPNIDMAMEYVNALDASRAYEANVTMMETTKSMLNATLRLIA